MSVTVIVIAESFFTCERYPITEPPEDSPDEWMPGEDLARLLARRLRLVEVIEVHEERTTHPHEWGWSIDLYCAGLAYHINLGEAMTKTATWHVCLTCLNPRLLRWFYKNQFNYANRLLVEEITLALEREEGMPKLEWKSSLLDMTGN